MVWILKLKQTPVLILAATDHEELGIWIPVGSEKVWSKKYTRRLRPTKIPSMSGSNYLPTVMVEKGIEAGFFFFFVLKQVCQGMRCLHSLCHSKEGITHLDRGWYEGMMDSCREYIAELNVKQWRLSAHFIWTFQSYTRWVGPLSPYPTQPGIACFYPSGKPNQAGTRFSSTLLHKRPPPPGLPPRKVRNLSLLTFLGGELDSEEDLLQNTLGLGT